MKELTAAIRPATSSGGGPGGGAGSAASKTAVLSSSASRPVSGPVDVGLARGEPALREVAQERDEGHGAGGEGEGAVAGEAIQERVAVDTEGGRRGKDVGDAQRRERQDGGGGAGPQLGEGCGEIFGPDGRAARDADTEPREVWGGPAAERGADPFGGGAGR